MGGVLLPIEREGAVARLAALGVPEADSLLDSYCQTGIFGELENGSITDEQFRRELGKMAGRELSWNECQHFWKGYFTLGGAPPEILGALKRFRSEGYRLIMLSNTNPFVVGWLFGPDFPGGQPLDKYFDATYVSYKCRVMKPEPKIFQMVLDGEKIKADETLMVDDGVKNAAGAASAGMLTFCPMNGVDWREEIYRILDREKG